uniref:Cell division protein FtsX n=1 Tax=Nonomuraea gerenzanensis TaxID=93944 RepID=A0A1M4DWL2_9ACTN|nr:Cell division protein FtsX [Nonomuraea gerenzanensis]
MDASTLRPLRVAERRRFRVDLRMLTAAAAVVVVGSATAVLVGGGAGGAGDQDRVTAATAAEVFGRDDADMTVFLCTATVAKESRCEGAVSSEQRQAIEQVLLEQTEQIAAGQWVSQAVAYDDFRERFAHNQAVLEEVKSADMPSSYRLKLREGADRRQVMAAFHGVAGVLTVIDHASSPYTQAAVQERQKWDVSVFLCKAASAVSACGGKLVDKEGDTKLVKEGRAATPAQVKAVQELIQKSPGVEEVVFEDEAAAYENFKEAFKDNKTLMEATRVGDMPRSFRIKLEDDAAAGELTSRLQRQPGVAQVVNNRCATEVAKVYDGFGLLLNEKEVCP